LALIALLIFLEIGNFIFSRNNKNPEKIIVPKEILALSAEAGREPKPAFQKVELTEFDPNHLTGEEWEKLGFSEKQVQTILKYKYSLGGNFTSKEQIKNCFVVSEKKFRELEPYIKIGKIPSPKISDDTNLHSEKSQKPKIQYVPFDPNQYTKQDWMKIGFSEKQANSILKYRKSLGGEFHSLAEIQKCYVISDEKFEEIKPYIRFSKIEEKSSDIQNPAPDKIEKFNPNNMKGEDWKLWGLTDRQINTIFNYKNSLGGKFKDAETFRKCYSISPEKFKEMEPYLDFNLD
jgi:DNA uptake protein ComE-like DNA-binding protein